jgi:hypothetical protein
LPVSANSSSSAKPYISLKNEITGIRQTAKKLIEAGFQAVPAVGGTKDIDLAAMGMPVFADNLLDRPKLRIFLNDCAATALASPGIEKQSREKWKWRNDHNIAIVTGIDRLYVLDFDKSGAFEHWCRLYPTIANFTPIVRSPRGYHVYLRSARVEMSTSIYLGLRRVGHAKGLGGYVIAPDSRNASGQPYEWVNDASVFDRQLFEIESLYNIGLTHYSPLKIYYDRYVKGKNGQP